MESAPSLPAAALLPRGAADDTGASGGRKFGSACLAGAACIHLYVRIDRREAVARASASAACFMACSAASWSARRTRGVYFYRSRCRGSRRAGVAVVVVAVPLTRGFGGIPARHPRHCAAAEAFIPHGATAVDAPGLGCLLAVAVGKQGSFSFALRQSQGGGAGRAIRSRAGRRRNLAPWRREAEGGGGAEASGTSGALLPRFLPVPLPATTVPPREVACGEALCEARGLQGDVPAGAASAAASCPPHCSPAAPLPWGDGQTGQAGGRLTRAMMVDIQTLFCFTACGHYISPWAVASLDVDCGMKVCRAEGFYCLRFLRKGKGEGGTCPPKLAAGVMVQRADVGRLVRDGEWGKGGGGESGVLPLRRLKSL